MRLFYSLFLVLVLIFHIFLLCYGNKKFNGVNTFSSVIFTLIVYVDLVPLIIYFFDVELESSYSIFSNTIYNCNFWQFNMAEIAVLVFTLFFFIFYRNTFHKREIELVKFDEDKMGDSIKLIAILSTIIGGISFLLYIRAFGSISQLLSYSEYFRTFRTNNTEIIGARNTLLIVPSRLIVVAPIALYTEIKSGDKHKKVLKIAFLLTLLLSIIFLFFNAGKTSLIIMLLCFCIPFLSKFTKHPWSISIIAGCFLLPILGILDSIFSYMSFGVWKDYSNEITSYIGPFSYVYANLLKLEEMVTTTGLRWGTDFVTGVINAIPGIDFEPSYNITSLAHFGPNWMQLGGTPDDLITFGYLQFGIIGIVLVATILGVFCGKIDSLLKQMDFSKYGVLITCMILSVYSYFINADIGVLIKSQFQLTLFTVCILYSFFDARNKHKRIRFVFGR